MRSLTRLAAQFFAGGPYRFLALMLMGLGVTGGAIGADWKNFQHSALRVQCSGYYGFGFYVVGACWYTRLIRRGTWKKVWDRMIARMDAQDDARRR